MKRICVFCGSRPGTKALYGELAEALGQRLAERGWGLVYGGGQVGLMGRIADATLGGGGEVFGVLPRLLARAEIAHRGLTRLEIVESMHERKARMVDLSDAFVALPGGIGTLDELFEALTWRQLRIHHKPIAVLDPDGYFEPMLAFLDNAVARGFLDPELRRQVVLSTDVPALLHDLESRLSPAAIAAAAAAAAAGPEAPSP